MKRFGVVQNGLLVACFSAGSLVAQESTQRGVQPAVSQVKIDKAQADLEKVASQSTVGFDPFLVKLRLTSDVSAEALKQLNNLLEPKFITVPNNITLREATRNYFGVDRDDLYALVKQLNPTAGGAEQEHTGENTGERQIEVPGIPPLKEIEELSLPEGADVQPIIKAYYAHVTGKELRAISYSNAILDGWAMRDSGKLTLPEIPGSDVVRLRAGGPMKHFSSDAPELRSPDAISVAATALANLRGISSGVQVADPDQLITLDESSRLSSTNEDCETLIENGAIRRDWYLDAIGARQVSKTDFPSLGQRAIIATIDSGVRKEDPSFQSILEHVVDLSNPNVAYHYGIDVTDPGSDFPEDITNDHHGTHVAGIATGRHLIPDLLDDSQDSLIVQVALRLLVVKLFPGPSMTGSLTKLNSALLLAAKEQPAVFNMSFEGNMTTDLQDRFSGATAGTQLYVIAAGNSGQPLDLTRDIFPNVLNPQNPNYSKVYQSALLVAAMKQNADGKFDLSSTSSYSSQNVQIAAPGECIESNGVKAGKPASVYLSGTSQAAPLVAFTAGMIAAKHHTRDAEYVKRRILESCEWDPLLEPKVVNGCRLNVAKALATKVDLIELKSPITIPGLVTAGGPAETHPNGAVRPLIRGAVVSLRIQAKGSRKFAITGDERAISLRRLWFGDAVDGSFKVLERQSWSVDKPVQQFFIDKSEDVVVKTDSSQCPVQYLTDGLCKIPFAEVRDILFADVEAKDD